VSRPGLIVASLVAVALLVVGVWQFMPPGEEGAANGEEENGREAAPFQPPPAGSVSVTGYPVHRGQLIQRITANGVAEAERLLRVTAEVQGKVAEIAVREGQWVEAGDLLVRLDDVELQLQRDRAEEALINQLMVFASNQLVVPGTEGLTVARADGNDESASSFLERVISEEAYRTIVAQPDLEGRLRALTREDLYGALAGLTAQRVALEEAELNLQRARVVAPFAGQVAGIDASAGPNSKTWPVVSQRVNAGNELMILVDPTPLRVRVEVIESEISFVREGRRTEVAFPAYPGETFNATIESIAPIVDATRKTLSVTVRLPNADRRLKPGLFADVILDTEIYEDRLLVPVDALLIRDNREVVFVARNGRAQWEYIDKGLENDDWVEIVGGNVSEGEIVITSGHFTLGHDAAVNVVDTPDAPGGGS
jgi:HlyD family secretion protein